MTEGLGDDPKEQAANVIKDMPAETALGNRDPEGGGSGTPADYEQQSESSDDASGSSS